MTLSPGNLRIDHLPLSALKPYANNARTHSKKQIKQIARSIERFGFTNPILIADDYTVIAGHGRLAAAKHLGLETVPAIRLSHLTDAKRRANVLADNQLALKAGWDRDLLALELQGLIDVSFDVELTGFELSEIEIVLDDAQEKVGSSTEREDQLAAGGPLIARPGDLWMLGEHRLYCGDAREAESYRAVLGDETADLVFTDPPYNVPIDGHVCGLGQIRHEEFAFASGEMSEREFTTFLSSFLTLTKTHARTGAIVYVCMDWRHLYEVLTAGREAGLSLKNLCVWNKDNGGMGTFYRSKHELVLVFKAGDGLHVNTFELGQTGRYRTNVWDYAGVNTMKAGRLDELAMHPTVKPVALVADALKDCSRRRDIVLDPFGGSGTTLIAAEKTGRRARVIEVAPKYVDVTVRRWQAFTGRQAVLEHSGQAWDEVEEERLTISRREAPAAA